MNGQKKKSILSLGGIAKGKKIGTGDEREYTKKKVSRKIAEEGLEKLPKFRSEKEEAEFWATHDSTEYIDYLKAKKAISPSLKPTTRTISIRLPESLIEHLKVLANKRDIPYQSLMKMFLVERIEEEFKKAG